MFVFVIPGRRESRFSLCFPGFRLSRAPARSAGMTSELSEWLGEGDSPPSGKGTVPFSGIHSTLKIGEYNDGYK